MIRAALALAAIVAFRGAFAAEGGLELLVARYADAAAAEQDVSRAAALRASMKADGSWGDIDYSDKSRSEWPVGAHVRARLRILAADWRRNGSRESLEAAHRALGFWLKHRFGNPNWWWNIIGVPMSLGDAGVMMDGELTDAERRGIIELMTVEEPGHAKTGQNFAWMSENRLRRGMLARDEALVRSALKDVLREVRMGEREGIRSDWCFHQHGEQPQFGNYGLSFLVSQSRLAALLAGTGFEYPPEKLELVRRLASEGYSWICWKGMMDVSAMGRQLHRDTQRTKAANVERAFENLEKTGWVRPAPRFGFRYFDKSAYAVYRAQGFMASVRASTPRIIGTETWINEDNAKGMCMADGALMTYATGREYENVFPLWGQARRAKGLAQQARRHPRGVRGRWRRLRVHLRARGACGAQEVDVLAGRYRLRGLGHLRVGRRVRGRDVRRACACRAERGRRRAE